MALAGVVQQTRPKRQLAPSNVKPYNYKDDIRKCTEALINSCITFPSKVCASQDPTKKKGTGSSKSVYIGLFVWAEGWHWLPYQDRFCLFTINPSIVRLDENAVGRSI